MQKREIYFLFTDTGTYLSKAINYFTKQELNHVSISFDKDFKAVYSFGRKRPRNPFIGGFVLEDINSEFLAKAECAIYRTEISELDFHLMMSRIKEIESRKDEYRYNFIGLFGVLFHIRINRRAALFCSEFVATIIQESDKFIFKKPTCFITPADIRNHPAIELIFRGKLEEYNSEPKKLVLGQNLIQKQSFIYYISNKFKQFVIK